jgi:hypothetical protein
VTDEKVVAIHLLAVVRDVYEEGRTVVGERWSLFKKIKEMADQHDAIGMLRYFEECLQSDRGKRVGNKLRIEGKKSLESEAWRIRDIVGNAVVEARVSCVSGVRDAARRKRLEESFETYWSRESITPAITAALEKRLRLRLKQPIVAGAGVRTRLNAVPFVFIRRTGPEFVHIRSLVEQAGEAYVLGLFEASAVVGRAALEVTLVDRWRATRREPPPREGTPERWRILLDAAVPSAARAEVERWALVVKKVGDAAAHGEEVGESQTRSALVALRRLFGEFHW